MQNDILKEYKNINEKIRIPDGLKEDTVSLMREGRPVRRHTAFTYAAAVLAGIVILGALSFQIKQRTGNDIMISDALDENSVKEQVELSKGSMYFQNISGEFSSPGLNLGVMDGQQISINEEDYFAYLGKNPLPSYIPKGMVKQDSGEQLLTKKEDGTYAEDIFSIKYVKDNESTMEIILSAQGIPEGEDAKELTGNVVNGVELKAAYYGTKPEEMVFLAYFQADGIGYKIKSRGISQEEFIQVILSIIKK